MTWPTSAALAAALLLPPTLTAPALETERHGQLAAHEDGHEDGGLAELRAGRAVAPSALLDAERARLRAEQERCAGLAALRAGAPTEEEWTWIAVGALVVLVIVLVA